jgi:hypothetical protein
MGGHAMLLPFLTPVQGCRKVRASLPFLRLANPFRAAFIDSSGALGLFVKVGKHRRHRRCPFNVPSLP